MANNWSQITAACGFHATGGRRAYNAQRHLAAVARRDALRWSVFWLPAGVPRISQLEAARRFGVSAATICRDMATLRAEVEAWSTIAPWLVKALTRQPTV